MRNLQEYRCRDSSFFLSCNALVDGLPTVLIKQDKNHVKKNKNCIPQEDFHMKPRKPAFAVVSLLAAASLLAPGAAAQTASSTISSAFNKTVFDQEIYANTYVTLGAGATINGSVWSGAATTLGASARVEGGVSSGAATTRGAGSTINGVNVPSTSPVRQDLVTAQSTLAGLTTNFPLLLVISPRTSPFYPEFIAFQDCCRSLRAQPSPSMRVATAAMSSFSTSAVTCPLGQT